MLGGVVKVRFCDIEPTAHSPRCTLHLTYGGCIEEMSDKEVLSVEMPTIPSGLSDVVRSQWHGPN